jgi:DNA-binding NarL/FixJ family response regulator
MDDNSIKIVVCDDHTLYRQGIKYVLATKNDVEIIGEADDGFKLLKLLKHVTPDLILLDINMPVMDGTIALPEIKKQYPDIKVLVVSMQNGSEMIEIMMERGADGYLTKNDDPEVIYEAIKTCYTNGRYIDKRTEDVLLNRIRKTSVPPALSEAKSPNPEIEEPAVESIFEEDPTSMYGVIHKAPWYSMPLRAILIGLGIAFAVFIGLYAYEAYKGRNTAKNTSIQTYENPLSYQYEGTGNNILDSVLSK